MEYMLVFIITICINGLTAMSIQQWDDPQLVTEECRKSGCEYPKLCYIPHPASCFKFIMCKRYVTGQITATAMSCGFGTMWKPGLEPACDSHTQVDCPIDLCRDPAIKAYSHDDSNCRAYWKCRAGKSEPACCRRFYSFNQSTGKCERDASCDSFCPLVNDATCQGNNVQYANVQDDNCKTYLDCKKGHPHPECCGEGEGFDVFKSKCVKDPNCLDVCPKEYSESCAVKGTLSYDLVDKNCRTYVKCTEEGKAELSCCLPGLMYNTGIKQCVDAVGKACSNARCPIGYKEVPECLLQAIPNDKKSYMVLSTPLGNVTMKCPPGSEFVQNKCRCLKKHEKCSLEAIPGKPNFYKNVDSYGGEQMPCAVGTIFNPQGCNCKEDPTLKAKLPPVGCRVDIDAHLPDLKNYGSAVAAILMIGSYGHGEKGVGNMSAYWHGGLGLNIPFYGTQAFWKMYLEIRFNPSSGSRNKQILLTSCQVTDGMASVEISMSQFHETGGIITLHAKNQTGNIVVFEFPYLFNKEYTFRVIYNGHNMGVFLDNQDPNLSNSAVESFRGSVLINRSGLRFTHCRYEQNLSGFIGFVREIKVSRCLTPEMEETLSTLVTGPAPAP